LIEGIYEELEMLDELLRGEKIGEWKKKQDEQEVEVIGVDRFEIKNGFERY
jgi:hypothetical protein